MSRDQWLMVALAGLVWYVLRGKKSQARTVGAIGGNGIAPATNRTATTTAAAMPTHERGSRRLPRPSTYQHPD